MGSAAGKSPSTLSVVIDTPQDETQEVVQLGAESLGLVQPQGAGDVYLAARVPMEAIEPMAALCKSCIVLLAPAERNDEDIARIQMMKSAGLAVEEHPLSPHTDQAGADRVLEAMQRLPWPMVISCASGNRAGAALLLFLAKQRGYTSEAAQQLAQDMDLKFWTRCATCGPVREWVLKQLPDGKEMVGLKREGKGAIVEQLFDPASCTFTYLIGCRSTNTALLIDPVLEQRDRDLAIVDELGFDLRFILNTHCHADHVTSGGRIKQTRPTVHTIISDASGAKSDFRVRHGDIVRLGLLELEVRATPGHTSGCVSYLLGSSSSNEGTGMIFTGDALLIRGCGRTDFQEGNSEQLYDSVHAQIFTLPDETLVYPGHDYKGRNVSTVGEEKQFNPRLTQSKQGFAKLMSELKLQYPKKIDVAVPANMVCGVQD